MAGASLLALLDDIASVLDDVAVMTKVAAKKTAGVLGDDLAVNAEQVSGVRAERELPVVSAVAVGSLKNKAILVPAALLISAFIPWAVLPLLMLGGLYLCLEGAEKIAERFHPAERHGEAGASEAREPEAPAVDLVALEADKIRGAIRTDFVLSAEIIVIALGTVAAEPFATQVAVLSGIAVVMTAGVYGFVAAIVKLDDVGFWLLKREGALARLLGRFLVAAAPRLMKLLTVVGTVAMFLVGGGILLHGWPAAHHALDAWSANAGVLADLLPLLGNALVGLVAGLLALGVAHAVTAWRGRHRAG